MAIENNSLEELLKAIDIIASQRVSENSAYDQTIICTIVDNSKAENYGYYTVTNDTITFEAYSDNYDYKVGDYVRVSIPNGDYSQQKFITGLYQYNASEVITYVSPLDTFMDVSPLVDNRATREGPLVKPVGLRDAYAGLIANGGSANIQSTENSVPVDRALEKQNWQDDKERNALHSNGIYDTIGLQADFICNVGQGLDMRTGSYGLELDLEIELDANAAAPIIHTVRLDSSDFFGNPYNFKVFSTQAQTYDISNLGGTIIGFKVRPYQRDDFYYYNGDELVKFKPETDEEGNLIPNIYVANIYVALGCDLHKIDNHTVKLFTTDSLEYKHEATDLKLEVTNTKKLSVLWYNKDENHKYIGFSDGKYYFTGEGDNKISAVYPEEEYLAAVAEDNRLRAQRSESVCDSFEALDAADNYHRASLKIRETLGYVENTFIKKMYAFKRELTGFAIAQVAVDNWVQNVNANLSDAKREYESFTGWKPNLALDEWFKQGHGSIRSMLYNENKYTLLNINADNGDMLNNDGTVFAPGIRELVADEYVKYRKVYEVYSAELMDIIAKIKKLTDECETYLGGLDNAKGAGKNTPFVPKDLTADENYYDIYWYHYNPDYTTPDSFVEAGWEPIYIVDKDGNPTNKKVKAGIPLDEDKENPGYLVKACPDDKNSIEVYLNENTHQEKFKVVIVYNHTAYPSNELIFTNADEFADDSILTSEAIYIQHGANSQDAYQMLYSSGYQLLNAADARLQRELKLTCREEDGGDQRLSGATIYWYVPTTSTMLWCDDEKLCAPYEVNEFSVVTGHGFTLMPEEEISEEAATELPTEYTANDSGNPYYRPGYKCFYKTLDEAPEDDASPEEFEAWAAAIDRDLRFYYLIKEYLVPCDLRNEIDCVVALKNEKDNVDLEAGIRLVFGSLGTNGTNYTLIVMPATKQYCVTNSDPMPITAALYDYDGNEVTDVNIEYEWRDPKTNVVVPTNYKVETLEDGEVGTRKITHTGGTTGVGLLAVGVAMVEIRGEETDENGQAKPRYVDLFMQYPVSWGADPGYYIAGATTITYDLNGGNPEYYKGPYVLYDKNSQPVSVDEWKIEWYEQKQNEVNEYVDGEIEDKPSSESYNFYKSYMPNLSNHNTLVPAPMYISGCQCYPVVVALQNGVEVWRQPILITQNRYPSKFLNNWDGSLQIDEKNGTIMANLVGAGKKETDNSFTGVLMGEVENVEIDTGRDAVLNRNHSGVGLYGFHHGQQSFGFNADGTAFLGKSGGGRISFDGNQGFIYSDNWLNGFYESKTTEIKDAEGNVTGVKVTTEFKDPANKPFQPIVDESNNIMYYELGEGEDGMAIDLRSGHIDANNFRLRSENIKMSSGKSLDDENKYIINFETSPMFEDIQLVEDRTSFDEDTVYYIKDEDTNQYIVYKRAEAQYKDKEGFPITEDGAEIPVYVLKYYMAVRPNDASFSDNGDELTYQYYTKEEDGTYKEYPPGSAYPVEIILYERIPSYYYEKRLNNNSFPGFGEDHTYYILQDDGSYIEYTETTYPEEENVYLYERYERGARYESRTKDEVVEPLNQYYVYNRETKEYEQFEGEVYPEPVLLYQAVERGHGYYHIRFDKNGKLELSISDATFLADKNITIGEYLENLNNEIIRIEDEVIGIPPELQGESIFDHITGQIVDIRDSLIGTPNDINAGSIYSYINAQEYISAEGMFNGLTKNGTKDGIFPVYKYKQVIDADGNLLYDDEGNPVYTDEYLYDEYGNPIIDQLYINASYIATGILRSKNWNGVLYYHPTDSDEVKGPWTIEQAEAAVANGEASWNDTDGRWSLSAAAGTYWNLNNGQLFARHFELNALDDNMNGLYLNNDPDDGGYYLSIGHPEPRYLLDENGEPVKDDNDQLIVIEPRGDFIQYGKNGKMAMQMKDFVLNAWTIKNTETVKQESGLVLDSNPGLEGHTGYWLSIGNQTQTKTALNGPDGSPVWITSGSFIQFDKNDNLTIQIGDSGSSSRNGSFILNAWNADNIGVKQGIYINSTGDDNGIYFRVGRGNEITVNTDSSELIEVSKDRVLIASRNFVLDAFSHWMTDGTDRIDPDSDDWIKMSETKKANYYEEGGIYITSSPDIYSIGDTTGWDSYFKIGTSKHFIQYTGDHRLLMNVNNFVLDAFDETKKKGIYFNSDPVNNDGDYWFIIGNGKESNPSFISMDDKGNFVIQTNEKFILNAWNDGKGLYLGSAANSDGYLFAIADENAQHIYFSTSGIDIAANNFLLDAWYNDQGIYLNSRPNGDYYLKIGNMSSSAPLKFIDVNQYSMFASDGLNVSVTVSSGTWYNYKYKILTDDEYKITVNEKFEYFIFDENNLPDGSAANLSCVEHQSYASNGSFTVENYKDKYLIINKPAAGEPFAIGENKNNSYITYHSDGTLKICVSNLAIGGQDFQDAVNAKIDDYNFITKLQQENLQGIFYDDETDNFYISSSYLQVVSKSGNIIFCADGIRKKVEIGGFKVTENSILSKNAEPGSINSVFMSTGLSQDINCSLGGSGIQNGWVFGAGKAFGVHSDGSLYSSSGMIGGWTIESTRLVANGDVACGLLSDNDGLMCSSLVSDGQSPLRIYLGSTSDFKQSYNITKHKINGSIISNNQQITAQFNLIPNETVKQFESKILKVSVPLMWVVKYKNASNIGNYSFDIPFALEDSNFFIDSVVVDKFSISQGVSTSWTEVSVNQYSWKEATARTFNGSTYYKTVSFKPNAIGTYRVSIYLKRILNNVIVSNSNGVATMTGILDNTVLPFNVLNFNLLDSLNRWYSDSEISTQPIYYYEPVNAVERSPMAGSGGTYSYKETYPQFGNYSKSNSSAIHPAREAICEGSCVVVYEGKAVADPTEAPIRFLDDGSIYAKAIKTDSLIIANTLQIQDISRLDLSTANINNLTVDQLTVNNTLTALTAKDLTVNNTLTAKDLTVNTALKTSKAQVTDKLYIKSGSETGDGWRISTPLGGEPGEIVGSFYWDSTEAKYDLTITPNYIYYQVATSDTRVKPFNKAELAWRTLYYLNEGVTTDDSTTLIIPGGQENGYSISYKFIIKKGLIVKVYKIRQGQESEYLTTTQYSDHTAW